MLAPGVGEVRNTFVPVFTEYGIAFDVAHNDGVTIDKINFKNVNVGHFIEMDASANVSVTGCTFKNVKKNSDYVKEAINLDTPDRETQGFHNDWSTYDKTPNQNVTIANCKFSNLGRAIGTHKYSANGEEQIYHKNIVLRNNRIENMLWDSPVRVMNWSDSDTTKTDGYIHTGCRHHEPDYCRNRIGCKCYDRWKRQNR